jgi:hypothetical protein
MTVSKEVQDAVDKVRAMKDYIAADKAADKIRDQQLADATAKQAAAETALAAVQAKLDAIPVKQELSQEDKDALQHAFDDASEAQSKASDAQSDANDVHDALKDAVPANTEPVSLTPPVSAVPPSPGEPGFVDPTPPPNDPEAPRPDPIAGTGQNGTVPLMPNLAFDPGAGNSPAAGGSGQPEQPPAIETAGGFVVSGGGGVQRAPEAPEEGAPASATAPADGPVVDMPPPNTPAPAPVAPAS